MFQSLLDFASPKIVKTEVAAKASASPAAQALVEKKAGGKVGEAPGRFAKNLEEARCSAKSEPGETRVQTGKPTGKDVQKELEQLLAGVSLEELSRLLSQLSPKDLANLAEVLGLKTQNPTSSFLLTVPQRRGTRMPESWGRGKESWSILSAVWPGQLARRGYSMQSSPARD